MDLYSILGVDRRCSAQSIKDAYRNLVKKYHPDKHTGLGEDEILQMNEEFSRITKAYEVLSDPKARKVYDRTGSSDMGNDLYQKAYNYVYGEIQNIVKSNSSDALNRNNLINVIKNNAKNTLKKINDEVSIARSEIEKVNKVKAKTKIKQHNRKRDSQMLMVYDDLKNELVQIIHDRLTNKRIIEEAIDILDNMEYET